MIVRPRLSYRPCVSGGRRSRSLGLRKTALKASKYLVIVHGGSEDIRRAHDVLSAAGGASACQHAGQQHHRERGGQAGCQHHQEHGWCWHRLTLAHGVLAFVFKLVVPGLVVNLFAGGLA